MKKLLLMLTVIGVCMFLTNPLIAQTSQGQGTLYQQEGGDFDQDPHEVDAAGQGPAGNDSDNWTNWKYQYGLDTWSGVYASGQGWLTESSQGDFALKVEADVEMYCSETISDHKIYFHLGNIYNATTADKTAYVNGTLASNNGQYVGISFEHTNKTIADFEEVGGALTGRIINAMKADHDTWRTNVFPQYMDVEILLWYNGYSTQWETPSNFGAGSHGTQQNVLWWYPPNNGNPGSYSFKWRIKLLPEANQPDGDYYLDPVMVVTPVL